MVVFVLAGCDAVFGVPAVTPTDAPPPIVDARPSDAPPAIVSGRMRLDYVTNNTALAPTVATAYYASTEATLAVVHDDGSTTPVALDPNNGAFTFAMDDPAQAYRLRVVTPYDSRDVELRARKLELVDRIAGRPDRTIATSSTISFSLGTVSGTSVLYSTGLWTQSAPPVPVNDGTFSYNWATSASESGPVGLLDKTQNDALYVTEVGVLTTGGQAYDAITSFVGPFQPTLTNGGVVSITSPLPAVSPNQCVHLIALAGDEDRRMTQALPRAYTQQNGDWQLVKTPVLSMGPVVSPWVAIAGFQDNTAAPIIDLDIAPQYFDPFNAATLATIGVVEFFSFQLPGAQPSSFGAIANDSRTFIPASATVLSPCNDNFAIVQTTVGLAGTNGTLGGALLPGADNGTIAVDLGHPIKVTWPLAAPGPADYTTVSLYLLTPDKGITTLHLAGSVDAVGNSATLDQTWFVPNATYALQFTTHQGYPNVASGDFATLTYPQALAGTWTHSFVVTAASM